MTASVWPSYVVVAVVSLCFGYWAGAGGWAREGKLLHTSGRQRQRRRMSVIHEEDEDKEEDEEEEDDENDGHLKEVKVGSREECKLVLVVRTDLGMTKGKVAAQCSHATLACYKALLKSNPSLLGAWEKRGQAKITLKADSEEELMLLEARAKSLNLCARSIVDAGRTQIDPGTRTVLGIGPAPKSLVDQVTGHLRLY